MYEASAYYSFARQFGYTPQQIRDLSTEEFGMLAWGIDEENKAQQEAQSGKKRPTVKGGSSADGEKISSVAGLLSAANRK